MLGDIGSYLSSPSNRAEVLRLLSEHLVLALVPYTSARLVRPVVDTLDAVPGHVVAAATTMGYQPVRRFVAVELPMAVPVFSVGVRVASVSNISVVSVGAFIGIDGLGQLFTEGFETRYLAPIVIGIVLIVLLALAMDLLLVGLGWAATPWLRT